MNQARGTYRHRAFSIIYGLENTARTIYCGHDHR
jgi:anthranilate/para-aminobenzoate synthase component I